VVAWGVRAVIEILDREAVVGTAMPASEESLDDLPSDQLHVPDARQALGIEVTLTHGDLLSFRWSADDLEQFLDHVVSRHAVAFGAEARGQAVAQDRPRDVTNVLC